jgi:hypothetical protein
VHPTGKPQKKTASAAFVAVLAGLLVAQALATAHVYSSNLEHHHKLTILHNSGYLIVPNMRTAPGLIGIDAALGGGLFFTLSIGAGLSLLSFAAAWLWVHRFVRSKIVLIFYSALLIGIIYGVNHAGFVPFVSLYFILIPAVVFLLTVKLQPDAAANRNLLVQLVPVCPLFILAFVWLTQFDSRLFVNIRDYFLLSNPVGMKINDFYYRYTLYAAEVFKPLDQKTIRTFDLSHINDPLLSRRLEQKLRQYDYLKIAPEKKADLTSQMVQVRLARMDANRSVLHASATEFLANTKPLLSEYSQRTDRYAFFRHLTFHGILFGFPALLYFLFYSLLRLVIGFFIHPAAAAIASASLCLVIGTMAMIPVHQGADVKVTDVNLSKAINSNDWKERVAAVKYIETQRLEISRFPAYKKMLTSPHVPERYWTVRALAASRDSQTFGDLLLLLKDPHPNVVSQTLYALGKRGGRNAISAIIATINASNSWYVQRYGYNALKSLGWNQHALK